MKKYTVKELEKLFKKHFKALNKNIKKDSRSKKKNPILVFNDADLTEMHNMKLKKKDMHGFSRLTSVHFKNCFLGSFNLFIRPDKKKFDDKDVANISIEGCVFDNCQCYEFMRSKVINHVSFCNCLFYKSNIFNNNWIDNSEFDDCDFHKLSVHGAQFLRSFLRHCSINAYSDDNDYEKASCLFNDCLILDTDITLDRITLEDCNIVNNDSSFSEPREITFKEIKISNSELHSSTMNCLKSWNVHPDAIEFRNFFEGYTDI